MKKAGARDVTLIFFSFHLFYRLVFVDYVLGIVLFTGYDTTYSMAGGFRGFLSRNALRLEQKEKEKLQKKVLSFSLFWTFISQVTFPLYLKSNEKKSRGGNC